MVLGPRETLNHPALMRTVSPAGFTHFNEGLSASTSVVPRGRRRQKTKGIPDTAFGDRAQERRVRIGRMRCATSRRSRGNIRRRGFREQRESVFSSRHRDRELYTGEASHRTRRDNTSTLQWTDTTGVRCEINHEHEADVAERWRLALLRTQRTRGPYNASVLVPLGPLVRYTGKVA